MSDEINNIEGSQLFPASSRRVTRKQSALARVGAKLPLRRKPKDPFFVTRAWEKSYERARSRDESEQ
jgi:hypothetical protein